jgi:hypothetical protein
VTGWPRRRLGTALIGFGAVGLALLASLAILVGLSLDGLGRAATDLERQRAEAIAMLEPAATALDQAATSAGNAGASLTSAAGAARRAGDLMTRLATSFDGLTTLGSFEIFGTRPFGALSGEFALVAGEARLLATNLGTTAASLDANVADSATVAASLRTLADQLERLRDSVGGTGAGSGAGGATDAPVSDPASVGTLLRIALAVIMALIAWLAIPAIAAIEIGRRWRRLPEPIGSEPAADSRVDSGG